MRGRTRRYAQKRDLSIVRSIQWRSDVSFASPTIFARSLHFGRETIPWAARTVVFGRRTENYLREEYLRQLSAGWATQPRKKAEWPFICYWDRTRTRRRRRRGCQYIGVAAMIARETRKEEESDGHLSMRIPLFSPRNNRLVFARPTRRFRRRAGEKKKSGTEDQGSGWLTRREGSSQHFFFVFRSVEKKGSIDRRSRDQKADDQGRSKIQARSPPRSGKTM